MKRVPPILILLLCAAAPLRAQEGSAMPPHVSVVVPVVGTVNGPNAVRWKTSLELRNDNRSEANVLLLLPAAPDQPFFATTLAPGQIVRYADVMGELFGLEEALSPLVVSTIGRRSVTIAATAYGVRGAESFSPQPIAINYGSGYYPMRVLQGLSFSEAFRTNVGLANLGDDDTNFVLALQRIPGRNVAVTRITVPPQTLWHSSIQSLFPLITNGDDFTVVVESGARDTYVYASVIENATSTAKFIDATIGAPRIQTAGTGK